VTNIRISQPFGDGAANTTGSRDNTYDGFTGLWDGAASSTNHAQYREYSNIEGRWLSSDPYDGSYDFSNPQSLNRYSYVMNNPLGFVDPSGRVPCNGMATITIYIYVTPSRVSVPQQSPDDCPDMDLFRYSQLYNQMLTHAVVNPQQSSVQAELSPVPTPRKGPRSRYESLFCLSDALKENGFQLALDAIGLIPEAEGFTKVFENTVGYQLARAVGNNAGYRGVVATQYGMKAVAQGKGGVAMINSALGLGDRSVEGRISTGATLAGFIPGLGTGAAAVSLGVDAYKILKAESACVDSGKYD